MIERMFGKVGPACGVVHTSAGTSKLSVAPRNVTRDTAGVTGPRQHRTDKGHL